MALVGLTDVSNILGREMGHTPKAQGICISRMRARSDAYARSEESNSSNACVRFDIVGGVGTGDTDDDASSSSSGDMSDGKSNEPGSIGSPSSEGSGPSFKSIDSNSPDNDA
jgi:hypothetical protein